MSRIIQLASLSFLTFLSFACDVEEPEFRKKLQGPVVQTCGGIHPSACPEGFACVDNLYDDCNPEDGDADCSGICEVSPDAIVCGGFVARACPVGLMCIDDPRDTCDPRHGGADCSGICTTDNTI